MATRNGIIELGLPAEPVRPGGGRSTFLSMISSLGAVLAACSCCILPMALAGIGVSAGLSSVLSPLGPLRWPMTAFAVVAVASSWFVVLRQRRRACSCTRRDSVRWLLSPRMMILIIATKFTTLAAGWSFLEPAFMRALV